MGGDGMALSKEVRESLQRQIDALQQRMRIDSNDLDYETHLRQVRELQRLLERRDCKACGCESKM